MFALAQLPQGDMGSMAIKDEQMLICDNDTTWFWPFEEREELFEKKCIHPCLWLHSHIGPCFANLNVVILYPLSFGNVNP